MKIAGKQSRTLRRFLVNIPASRTASTRSNEKNGSLQIELSLDTDSIVAGLGHHAGFAKYLTNQRQHRALRLVRVKFHIDRTIRLVTRRTASAAIKAPPHDVIVSLL